MQGNRGILDSFPETIDLNQGSVSSNAAVDPIAPWDNMLNPVEDRLLLSSARENPVRANAGSYKTHNYSGWDQGESSSSVNGSDLKIGHGWPSSASDFSMTNTSSPNLASARSPLSANLSGLCNHHGDTRPVLRPSLSPTVYTSSSRVEAENTAYNVGTSSGGFSYWAGTPDISGSSMDSWGLSCKRKALEGGSGQSCGGSSSSNAEPENTIHHNFPSRFNASSSLNISPATDVYPPPVSASGVAETYARHFGFGINPGNQDTITFGLPLPGTDLRRSSVGSGLVPPRPISHVSGVPRGVHPAPWGVSANTRGGSSSSPNIVSGDGYASSFQDEANFRNSTRSNTQPLPFVVAPETRNMVQDPTNWSLSNSNVSYSRTTDPSTGHGHGHGHGSSVQTFPTAWMPNQHAATSSNRNLSEFSPWPVLPPVESESGSRRGHFSLLPSATSSMEEASSSRGNHQLHHRSTAMTNFAGNDVDGWRGLAADIEGRHRLIRQMLHAMRRVENTRSEDYMLFDPFLNGIAEFHDRHRGMRLDVDNMSYEELLALEERMGNVNTGLSEETIWGRMNQRKHEPISGFSSTLEPCCICREEYTRGDDMGILDCGHEFHSSCIKQWLLLKNLCPICKMTALET